MRTAWITNAEIAVGKRPQPDRQRIEMDVLAVEEALDQQHGAEREEHVLAEEHPTCRSPPRSRGRARRDSSSSVPSERVAVASVIGASSGRTVCA